MKAASYRLDDAVNAACMTYEPGEWGLILAALDGRAPRIRAAKPLRCVRDRARAAGLEAARYQHRLVREEQRYWVEAEGAGPCA